MKLRKQSLPDRGAHYHRELLKLAIGIQLVAVEHVDFLYDLMSFRHFTRHAYGATYRLDEIKAKAARAEQAWPDLRKQLADPRPEISR